MDDEIVGERLRSLVGLAEHDDEASEVLVEDILRAGTHARRRRGVTRGSVALVAALLVGGGVAGAVTHVPGSASMPAGPAVSDGPSASPTVDRKAFKKQVEETEAFTRAVTALFPGDGDLGRFAYVDELPWVGANQPTVQGPQMCDPTFTGPAPDAVDPENVATMDLARPGSAATGVGTASLTISTWADGATGWQQLVDDTGGCRWIHVKAADWPGGGGPDRVFLVGDGQQPSAVVAARRVGDRIVAAFVDAGSRTASKALALQWTETMAERVQQQGFPVQGAGR